MDPSGGPEEGSCCYLPGASELVWELGVYSAPGLGLEGEVGQVGERDTSCGLGLGWEERRECRQEPFRPASTSAWTGWRIL